MSPVRCESRNPTRHGGKPTQCAGWAVAVAHHPGGPPWPICEEHIRGLGKRTMTKIRPLSDQESTR